MKEDVRLIEEITGQKATQAFIATIPQKDLEERIISNWTFLSDKGVITPFSWSFSSVTGL